MTSCPKTSKTTAMWPQFLKRNFFLKKNLIFGEFSSEKKGNLRENIPDYFFAHPSANIGPKNKILNSKF
jgi:hypothetical protein